ncbi:MAG: ArsA family ATPase [Arenicellales bacterium]
MRYRGAMVGPVLLQRLIMLSGKGGVGKTTLAALIARELAASGQRVVLVTLDTRDIRHPIFEAPLDYKPQSVRPGLWVARVDPLSALIDYTRSRLPFGALYEPALRSRAVRDFTGALPGFDELMLLGRLYNLTVELGFDRVVFDAPALGHLRQLLGVPGAMQRAMVSGPVRHVADRMAGLLFDPVRTVVLPVTLPEQMPVSETLELIASCRDHFGMAVGPVLINRTHAPPFSPPEWAQVRALGDSVRASQVLRDLIAEAEQVMDQSAREAEALMPLAAVGVDRIFFPERATADALLDDLAPALATIRFVE